MSARRSNSARASRPFGIALLVLALALALVGLFMDGGDTQLPGSVRDRHAQGRRAALALATELGLDARASNLPVRAAPGREGGPAGALWLAELPSSFEPAAESREAPPIPVEELGPASYRRFLAAGGTLVVPARAGAREFVTDWLGAQALGPALERWEEQAEQVRAEESAPQVDAPGQATSPAVEELDPHVLVELPLQVRARRRGAITLRGEVYQLSLEEAPLLEEAALGAARSLAGNSQGGVLIALESVGPGRVALLASDAFLSNEQLPREEHAAFFVSLARELARGGPLRFDEFALGDWRPEGPWQWSLGARMRGLTLHLALALALLVWRAAWPREFVRDPEAWQSLSALERARSDAGLALRARRPELLARALRAGMLEELCRARHLPLDTGRASSPASPASDAGDAGDASPASVANAHCLALLTSLLRAAGRLEELGAWRASLLGRSVRVEADLERLAADLERLGDELRAGEPRTEVAGSSRLRR